jgi:hypothetical protein
MTNDPLLEGFDCSGDEQNQWCQGEMFVPFWGSTLTVWVETSAIGIEMLREIIAYKGDLRTPFIQAVFDYYTKDIYGSYIRYDEERNDITHLFAPHVTEPDQLWPMLRPLSLTVRSDRSEEKVNFSLAFKCSWDWDEECGLGVRYVDWQIAFWGRYNDV